MFPRAGPAGPSRARKAAVFMSETRKTCNERGAFCHADNDATFGAAADTFTIGNLRLRLELALVIS